MNVRKLIAATAVAGGFVLAGSSLAFASEARTEQSLAPGQRVCVSLPAAGDAVPVRAEGFGDPGLTYTLTSDGQLVAESTELPVFTTIGAPGALEFCAANGGDADAFVTLSLTSGRVQEANVDSEQITVFSAPAPVEVNAPAPDDGAGPDASVQSVVDQVRQLIDEIIEQVRDAVAGLG